MTSIVQYVKIMRDAQWDIANKLGSDLSGADKQTRVLLLSNLAIQAVLIKALVDSGVISNAALLAALNAVRTDAYSPGQEPTFPVPWEVSPPVTGV